MRRRDARVPCRAGRRRRRRRTPRARPAGCRRSRAAGGSRRSAGLARIAMPAKAKRGAGAAGAEGAGGLDLARSGRPSPRPASAARRGVRSAARSGRRPAGPAARQPRHRRFELSPRQRSGPRPSGGRRPSISRPSAASRCTAAPRSMPGTERPEPLPMSPSKPITTAGRFVGLFQPRRDDADDAGVPAVARGPDQRRVEPARLGLRQGGVAHLRPRSRAVRCSARRAVRPGPCASCGSSVASSRAPRSAWPIRPPALTRGPSRKPR